MQEGYRILDHPADVGIEAFGKTLPRAFENAARGLLSIIVDPASVRPVERRSVSLKGSDVENLLVRWLSEINYLYDGEGFLTSESRITKLNDVELEADLFGEHVNQANHILKTDVKAITYHQLKVEQTSDGTHVTVFLDI